MKEMVQSLGFHKSSVQRIVYTFEANGFLERCDPDKSAYRLGNQFLVFGEVASRGFDLTRIAVPILRNWWSRLRKQLIYAL